MFVATSVQVHPYFRPRLLHLSRAPLHPPLKFSALARVASSLFLQWAPIEGNGERNLCFFDVSFVFHWFLIIPKLLIKVPGYIPILFN